MNFDVESYLGAVTRSVSALERDGQPARAVTLTRTYDTSSEDLWDALTNPERLPRWFLPISGDLKLGGRYQLQGNAGGTITSCEPPTFLSVTWEFGGGVSWVEVQINAEGARARLTLVHTAPINEHWDKYGPGAVGVGWDLGLLGLGLHLADPDAAKFDENTFHLAPQGKAFIVGSSEDWISASIACGTDAAHATTAGRLTTAFYTGEPA